LSFQLEPPNLQNCCHSSGSWNSSGKFYFTLGCISLEPTARQKDHLLLKKNRVAALAFLQINISSYLENLLQKTSAEHGRIGTEETRALISKARQNQSK
jgi:hypothetical protein